MKSLLCPCHDVSLPSALDSSLTSYELVCYLLCCVRYRALLLCYVCVCTYSLPHFLVSPASRFRTVTEEDVRVMRRPTPPTPWTTPRVLRPVACDLYVFEHVCKYHCTTCYGCTPSGCGTPSRYASRRLELEVHHNMASDDQSRVLWHAGDSIFITQLGTGGGSMRLGSIAVVARAESDGAAAVCQ